MGLDLGYERLAFARRVAENTSDTVVEGTVSLPESAPAIGRPLRLEASPRVKSVEVHDDKVLFEGVLDLQLLYVHFEEREVASERRSEDDWDDDDYEAEGGDQSEVVVEERLNQVRWEGGIPFAFLLDLPGVREGQEVSTEAKVNECRFEVRSDQMTLDVDVSVQFGAGVSAVDRLDIATSVRGSGEVDVERKAIRVRNLLDKVEGTTVVQASLSLAGRAEPERILRMKATPEVTDAFVENGSVRVKGNVNYELFYVGAEGAGPQFTEWRRGAGFEVEIPAEGARRGAWGEARVEAAPSQCSIVDAEGGRSVEVRTPLAVKVDVVQTKELNVIVGLSSDKDEIATRVEGVEFVEAVGEGQIAYTAQAGLELPSGSPGIERVLFAEAEAVVDDVHVLGDKVAVEFHVDVELAYVGRAKGERGVHVARWPSAVQLDLEVPVEGAEPGLERDVKVRVQRVQCEPVNRESVEAEVYLVVQAALSRPVGLDVVAEAVQVPPAPAEPPSYTFVVVEPGDTLWKLAAFYRSDPEAIAQANSWLESTQGPLPAGRKICVPRKVRGPAA